MKLREFLTSWSRQLSCRRIGLMLAVGAWLCSSAAAFAAAPPPVPVKNRYKTVPYGANFTNSVVVSKAMNAVNRLASGSMSLQGNEATFDDFFNGYFFPSMTQPAALSAREGLGQIDVMRTNLKRWLESSARRSPAFRDRLRAATLTQMQEFLKTDENYHPGTKYNAILILGGLNETEGSPPSTLPVPLAQTLPIMVNELENANQLDAVKLGAMLGILRFVRLGTAPVPGPTQTKLTSLMLGMLQETDPPAGRSPAAHAWFQRRALDMLAALKEPGANGSTAAEVAAIVGDESKSLPLRAAAAEALGKFSYTGTKTIDGKEAARKLGRLALDICQDELTRVEEQARLEKLRELLKSGASDDTELAYGEDESGYGDADDEEEEYSEYGEDDDYDPFGFAGIKQEVSEDEARKVDYTRRRVKGYLKSVRLGLTNKADPQVINPSNAAQDQLAGVYLLATPDDRAAIEALIQSVNDVDSVLDPRSEDDELTLDLVTLTTELREKVTELEQTLGVLAGDSVTPASPAVSPAPVVPSPIATPGSN